MACFENISERCIDQANASFQDYHDSSGENLIKAYIYSLLVTSGISFLLNFVLFLLLFILKLNKKIYNYFKLEFYSISIISLLQFIGAFYFPYSFCNNLSSYNQQFFKIYFMENISVILTSFFSFSEFFILQDRIGLIMNRSNYFSKLKFRFNFILILIITFIITPLFFFRQQINLICFKLYNLEPSTFSKTLFFFYFTIFLLVFVFCGTIYYFYLILKIVFEYKKFIVKKKQAMNSRQKSKNNLSKIVIINGLLHVANITLFIIKIVVENFLSLYYLKLIVNCLFYLVQQCSNIGYFFVFIYYDNNLSLTKFLAVFYN